MTDREPLAGLRLLGGRPCLDFCNTVEEREKPGAREFLTSYGDLIAWAERAGLVAGTGARSLLAEAGRHPVAARAPFDEALVLREALFRVFSSVVTGEPAAVPDVELL